MLQLSQSWAWSKMNENTINFLYFYIVWNIQLINIIFSLLNNIGINRILRIPRCHNLYDYVGQGKIKCIYLQMMFNIKYFSIYLENCDINVISLLKKEIVEFSFRIIKLSTEIISRALKSWTFQYSLRSILIIRFFVKWVTVPDLDIDG